MAVNKVVVNTENGKETLIDLTKDTVTPEALVYGATAHDASGNIIVGTATPVNVKCYGAKGDGITDDTVAFQTALSENRTVFVSRFASIPFQPMSCLFPVALISCPVHL